MAAKPKINLNIVGVSKEYSKSFDATTADGIANNEKGKKRGLKKNKVSLKLPTVVTIPNHVIIDHNYTNRGEYENRINIKRLREKYKDDSLIEYIERARLGLRLTPDENVLFYECLFGWCISQSINGKDPKNDYFLVNSYTGRRGDVVIGTYDYGKETIDWKILAEDFYNKKAKSIKSDTPKTKKELAKIDDQTQNFKKMVTSLATNPKKRFAVSYLEQNEFGENINIERIIQPISIEIFTNEKGFKYVVLHLADYFIYQNGMSYTRYTPAKDSLLQAIQANPKARTATYNLLTQIRVLLSASIKKMKVNKEFTKEYNEKHNDSGRKYIVERVMKLATLINDTSAVNIKRQHHKDAHDEFFKAVVILNRGDVIYNIKGSTEFSEWLNSKDGKLPEKYKTWKDFYNNEKVTLYLVKDN